MSLCAPCLLMQGPMEGRRVHESPPAGVTDGYEQPNPGPLEKH